LFPAAIGGRFPSLLSPSTLEETTMRRLLILAAALAASGSFALGSAQAQNYYQGGPRVVGANLCQVTTDGDQRYGYVAPCPAPVVHHRKHKH
jgi:hypothetical protein